LLVAELNLCPHCGGVAKYFAFGIRDENHFVACVECDTATGVYRVKEDARDAWNKG